METELDFFPFSEPKFQEKIVIPTKNTILNTIELPKFEINQKKNLIDKKYRFIDLDKLLKIGGKKYNTAELKEIASKINIPVNKKKLELVRLIKLKIGVE